LPRGEVLAGVAGLEDLGPDAEEVLGADLLKVPFSVASLT